MARQIETDQEAREQLWKQLQRGRIAMLWIPDSGQHPQPMSIFPEEDANAIWFITSSGSDLAKAVGHGAEARMTFVPSAQDYHASLEGALEVVHDGAKIDALWSTPVAAWFEGGREDPTVRLLRFTPAEAAIWASQSNPVLVGMKMLRAGLKKDAGPPDVGVQRVIDLRRVA